MKTLYLFLWSFNLDVFRLCHFVMLSIKHFPKFELRSLSQFRSSVKTWIWIFFSWLQLEGINSSTEDTLRHPGWVANAHDRDRICSIYQLLSYVVNCSVWGCATQDFWTWVQSCMLQYQLDNGGCLSRTRRSMDQCKLSRF